MTDIINLSRRDFLKTGAIMGTSLLLGFYMPIDSEGKAKVTSKTFSPNAFIRIGSDDTITLIINKSEMGQGVYTSLPMLIAEELECELSKIKIQPAPVNPIYNHTEWGAIQGTGGSSSVRSCWDQLRKAGAAARLMLINAASQIWKVDPSECRAEKGFIIHEKSKKRLSFGSLVEKASTVEPPNNIVLKSPDTFKVIGKPTKHLDTKEKVNGKAIFGIDVKVPGMLTALVARPPVFGAKVKSYNAENAMKVNGVMHIIQIPSGVAVVAKDFWSAYNGRGALDIKWDVGENSKLSTDELKITYSRLANTEGLIAKKDGEAKEQFKKAHKKITAEYEVPYLSHSPMETLNCLIDYKEDRAYIWTGTQMQTLDRNAAASILNLDPQKVFLYTTYLGGGFGRRANPHSDFVSEAAHIAKELKKPVKVIWSRQDDIKGGYYRPMYYHKISAGLDEKGNLNSWLHTIVGQSIVKGTPFEQALTKNGIDKTSTEGAHDIPYEIPNIHVDLHSPNVNIPVLWWRSVGHSHTAFVVESFIDEAAHLAKKDPYEFRKNLLKNQPKYLSVLELAAEKAGWKNSLEKGKGRGIAVHKSFGSYVAQVAEVSLDRSGKLKVSKVICAIDCGRVINPSTVEAQMESGIVFGLSAALFGSITIKDGMVEQSNFHDYQILTMKDMPKVEVYIVKSNETPQGVGEPGVPPIAPAICNAIFSLTGKRIRKLPINLNELKIT
ncbi:MAG: xanthine dehydrogenase family protein molybdopterin-binding subunit [Thermodesulfovibrionales bacterium]|nr:xanthine dehydrogenase family protein molybdopterin-binding subunit [Thermodesulfovibrionales bacterium]